MTSNDTAAMNPESEQGAIDIEQDTATDHKLCRQYGFDHNKLRARLAQLNLGSKDAEHLAEIQRFVIQPSHQAIMDDFYAYILQHAELKQFIATDEQLRRLKQTQTEYLLTLGINYDNCDYFEYRLRVGIAHARIEMPLSSYLVAYGRLQEILIDKLTAHGLSGPYYKSMCKVLLLDMSLAIDAYNVTQIKSMSDSIHELEGERARLNNQLMHDTLTSAYSRAYILEQLDKRLAEISRDKHKQLAVALIDLDRFKTINDMYGHPAGDQVLFEFTQTVTTIIRRQDYLGRYGGEEFLLVLVDLDEQDAFEFAERIRRLLAKKIYQVGDHLLHVTASIGLTIAMPGESMADLIARADKALYEAKHSGRNRTVTLPMTA